ncbi:hypothetical protein XMIN_4135 [Xanthomonas citri pv. mangiferaeindicae LMG 941]|nr:hypothetical protein XMIN_4135 [Xanthomonas citri pv. mangiferaeindicae LMG 941]
MRCNRPPRSGWQDTCNALSPAETIATRIAVRAPNSGRTRRMTPARLLRRQRIRTVC